MAVTRLLAVACAAVIVGALAGEASADRRAGVDRRAGFAFELQDKSLTVGVLPGQGADRARRQVFGKMIDAICASTFTYERASIVKQTLTWPAGQDQLTFDFGRDISRSAKGCLLEDDAADVATVGFGRPPAKLFVETLYAGDQVGPRARTFLRLRDDRGRSVLFTRAGVAPTLVVPVEAGRYRLIRYERRCRRSCRVLGPPTLRCARRIRLSSGRTTLAGVRVNYGRRTCRIAVTPKRTGVITTRTSPSNEVADGAGRVQRGTGVRSGPFDVQTLSPKR